MTNPLRIDKWFSRTKIINILPDDPFKSMKTTTPSSNAKPVPVNILRIVYEHSGSELDDIDSEILEYTRKIEGLKLKKKYIAELKKMADEYYSVK